MIMNGADHQASDSEDDFANSWVSPKVTTQALDLEF
jgi:hypothetical protein